METVVNNPPQRSEGNGMGLIVGAIILLAALILFFIYGLPYVSSMFRAPQMNVPNRVDINVHGVNPGK